jgi:hypothetical protein
VMADLVRETQETLEVLQTLETPRRL